MHDTVDPFTAEQRSEEIAGGVGDVEQADYEGGERVGWGGESGLDADVEDVETAECYASVVDSKKNGWEAEPCYDA